MESSALSSYTETLRILKENPSFEILYKVHQPGCNGFQHGYQLHGYVDGLFLRHLQSQGLSFFYEKKFEVKYIRLVPDDANLRFCYRQTDIRPYPQRNIVSFEYCVDVTDQEDHAIIYLNAFFTGSGPAENIALKKGVSP